MGALIPNCSGAPLRVRCSLFSVYGVNAMSENSLRTILVVDDEPKVRRLVVRALAGAGYAVQEARNGVEGVALFEMHKLSLIHI